MEHLQTSRVQCSYLMLLVWAVSVHDVDGQWSEQHKLWKFETGVLNINTSIVAKVSNSRSLMDCSTTCATEPAVVSLYFDDLNSLCHCNNETDPNIVTANTGQYKYGQLTLSYVAETSDSYRNVTSTSPKDVCLQLRKEAFEKGLFDTFPSEPPNHSLFTYCAGYYPTDWIIFQRRQDGSVNFSRYWNDYANGFGSPIGEFWLGLDNLHNITKNNICELNITMEADPDNPNLVFGYAHYDRFSVTGSDDNYTLTVSGFSGNVGDCLTYHSGSPFSTIDVDNDVYPNPATNCAAVYKAAWWYRSCHASSLNGQYFNGYHASFADGVNWSNPWGFKYSLIRVEMMTRCVFHPGDNI